MLKLLRMVKDFFGNKGPSASLHSLDDPLYLIPGTKGVFTHGNAVEATLIAGAPGSGKTSAAAKMISNAMLQKGYGLCVLCAKPDEGKTWVEYAKNAGRSEDVVWFKKGSNLEFNFLQYELNRTGEGAGDTGNITNYLMMLYELTSNFQAGNGGGGNDDRFWDQSLRRMISRTIALLKFTNVELTMENLRRVVADCFSLDDWERYDDLLNVIKELTDELVEIGKKADENHPVNMDEERPKEKLEKELAKYEERLSKWTKSNFFLSVWRKVLVRENLNEDEQFEQYLLDEYWLRSFPKLSDKTKAIIVESYNNLVEGFTSGILRQMFSKGVSEDLKPENTYLKGKIVIVDFPVKEFGVSGLYASAIYKIMFQAAMERRNTDREKEPRVVGLHIDEYQNFISPQHDSLFMATSRSSMVACVFITQNIHNIMMCMGRENAEARAKSLLANIGMKYFCSNNDFETNQYASNLIGEDFFEARDHTYSGDGFKSEVSKMELRPRLRPDQFTNLKTGRKRNKFKVEAIAFKAGFDWQNEQNYAVVEFDQ